MTPSKDHDADREPGAPSNTDHEDEERGDQRAGGDAEAAGSVEEREAIARGDDDTWEQEPGAD